MDRTSQYCHFYHFIRQENEDREDDKDAKEYNEAEGVFEEGQIGQWGVSNGGNCTSIGTDQLLYINLNDTPLAYRSLNCVLITSNRKGLRSPVA